MPNDQPAIIANRYVLHEKLGTGGMGLVYRATDRLNGTVVALKRLPLHTRHGGEFNPDDVQEARLALTLEFRTLASLKHPNIVTVLDYGFETDADDIYGHPYFTMKLLDSPQTIREAAEDRRLAFQVKLIAGMLQALAYLHRRGVIHRDLKPGNVLVTKDRQVKVLDFGLSVAYSQSLTNPDDVMVGTLHYMAPEIFTNPAVTPQSDLWAAGIIMYEIFTGKYPFDDANSGTLLYSILNDAPDMTGIEPGIAELLTYLLAKNPADRYSSAEAVLRALARATNQPLEIEDRAIRESFLQASTFVGREKELDILKTALDAIIPNQPFGGAQRAASLPAQNAAESGTDARDGQRLSPPARSTKRIIPLPAAPLKPARGSAWLIGGESGVGKSRLLDEVRIRALVRGAWVLYGQAVADGGQPYQVWRAPLRLLLLSTPVSDNEAAVLKQFVPDIETLIGRPVPDITIQQNQQGQSRLESIILSLFHRQTQPLVVILEDLQWAADDLPLLHSLVNMVRDLPLVLIGSYRDDEMPQLPDKLPGAKTIRLPRLTAAEIEALAASIVGEGGRQPQVIDLLNRETEGNVFFIVEVLRALAEEAGALAEIGRKTLPDHVFAGGMQHVIQRRLNRVPEDARSLLRVAAVIGRQVDLRVLFVIGAQQDLLVHNTDLDDWLTVCANAAVLESVEGNWRFAHDKLREAILDDLSDFERRGIHWRVAEAIAALYPDDSSKLVTLAEHWREVGDVDQEYHYILRAGDAAYTIHAHQEVISYTERALMILGRTRLPDRPQHHARLEHRLGVTRLRQGNLPQARAHLQRSLGLYRHFEDQSGKVHIINDLGWIDQYQGRYVAARECHEAALELARSLAYQPGTAEALICLGTIERMTGDYAQARAHYEQSLTIYRQINDYGAIASSINEMGILAYVVGDYDEARARFEERLGMGLDVGHPRGVAEALHHLGEVSAIRGDFEQAATYYRESLAASRRIADRQHSAYVLHSMGIAAAYQNRVEQAHAYYAESLTIFRELDDKPGIAGVLVSVGRLALRQQNYTAAEQHFRDSLALYEELDLNSGIYATFADLGELARLRGNTSEAAEYLQESLTLAQQDGVPTGEAAALNQLALVRIQQHDYPAARALLNEALRKTWAIRALRDLMAVMVSFARLYLAEGDLQRSAELAALVESHPATPYDVSTYGVDPLRQDIQAALQTALEQGERLELQAVVSDLLKGE